MVSWSRSKWTALLVAAALVIPVAISGAQPSGEGSSAATRMVTSVGVARTRAGETVTIRGNGPLDFKYFLIEGKSLVVDIYDAANDSWPTVRKVDGPFLKLIKIGEHFQPRQRVRVLLELQQTGDYKVRGDGSEIVVTLGKAAAPTAAPREAPPPSYNSVMDMSFLPLGDKSKVEVKTSAKPAYEVLKTENPLQVVVDISNARLSPGSRTVLDLDDLERELKRVNLIADRKGSIPTVRIVAQLRRAVPFRVSGGKSGLSIDIDHAVEMLPPAAAAPVPSGRSMVRPGRRISLDFVDADVNDMLRLISDVSGVNFAAGREVQGKVSIRLIDVPWEVALDTILMTNTPRLAQVPIMENIIRITTEQEIIADQEQEQKKKELERRKIEAERKLEEEKKELEPLVSREFSISYAELEGGGFLEILKGFTSARVEQDGYFEADPRTNTVLVRDLRENVDQIARTIRILDSPTPAVVVEARIVEMDSQDAAELGVQWGLGFTADQAHGNALPFEFPNSVGVQGDTGAGTAQTPFMVNLPVASATSGVGISFGHIANTLSLDLRLQAMEELGKTKVISSPRVLVVQNEKAKINVGQELPIPSTDAEGNRTVTWREVGIGLEVEPQVTNDQRVFMEIKVAKESPGPTVNTTEGAMFSINSRKAETQVLIGNGETAVIGGLTEETRRDSESRTPLLWKVPLLGWLFRSKSKVHNRQEMLIFLTPRILPSQ